MPSECRSRIRAYRISWPVAQAKPAMKCGEARAGDRTGLVEPPAGNNAAEERRDTHSRHHPQSAWLLEERHNPADQQEGEEDIAEQCEEGVHHRQRAPLSGKGSYRA